MPDFPVLRRTSGRPGDLHSSQGRGPPGRTSAGWAQRALRIGRGGDAAWCCPKAGERGALDRCCSHYYFNASKVRTQQPEPVPPRPPLLHLPGGWERIRRRPSSSAKCPICGPAVTSSGEHGAAPAKKKWVGLSPWSQLAKVSWFNQSHCILKMGCVPFHNVVTSEASAQGRVF